MIDDTQSSVNADNSSSSLSEEVLRITKYRTYRNNALDWSKKLRFLAWDAPDDLLRLQECSHCASKPRCPSSVNDYFDPEILHVCDRPFHNQHKIKPEDIQTHPQRFACDVCHSNIYRGMRNHCGQCAGGDYDICDACVASGKHCLDAGHELEKTPVFKFGDCVHVNARSCDECKDIPVFPHEGEVTSFRIVQPGEGKRFSSCDHFIAVSYCWPTPQYDANGNMVQHEGRYSVKDKQGRVRRNRAPEDVITRAVKFAAQNGIRLIWIDQECIDQDDLADKELGIQAMDKVYQRAFLSIGLLRTRIETQETLDSLQYLLAESGEVEATITDSIPTSELVDAVMSFFEPILADPWHTRAWILQEAFSAGSRMCLLLERNPDIQMREFRGISRILSKTEIVLYHDMFLTLLQYAEGYLQRSLVMLPLTDDLSRRRILLLRACRNFIPGDEKSVETKWTHQIGKTRARRSCNAAVALSFLRTRQNTHVPDRLAILANLCNYEIRLDTFEVEKHFTHLGICVLALALLNGDFSILYPEVYDIKGVTQALGISEERFSWMTPNAAHFHKLDARSINSLAHYYSHVPDNTISDEGLTTRGYLWKIDRRLYLTGLFNEASAKEWFRVRHFVHVFHILRSPFYTQNIWKEYVESQTFRDLDDEKRDEYLTSIGKGEDLDNEERETWAADLRIKILKQWSPDMDQRFLGLVLYHLMKILYFLRDAGEIEVADAIWQSVRTDNWDIQKTLEANHERGWFQSVADFPPTSEGFGLISIPDTMFQLDASRDGAYLQCWIIDTVMRDGWLAVGNFVRVSSGEEFALHQSWMPDEELEDVSQELENTKIQDASTSEAQKDSSLETQNTPSNETYVAPVSATEPATNLTTNPSLAEIKKNIDTQLFKQLMQSTFLSLNDDIPPVHLQQAIPLPEDAYTDKEKQDFLGAALLYSRVETDWSLAGLGKLREMRAVFDVNSLWSCKTTTQGPKPPHAGIDSDPDQNANAGLVEEGLDEVEKAEVKEEPIYVLTPWNQRTERLPHAEARAMSMSWVVEPTGEMPDGEQGIREVFRTRGMVRGMWKLVDQPGTEYRLV